MAGRPNMTGWVCRYSCWVFFPRGFTVGGVPVTRPDAGNAGRNSRFESQTALEHRHYINGEIVEAHGSDIYPVTSAISGEQIAAGVLGDEIDAEDAIRAAKQALPAWSATTLDERRQYLQQLADSFHARRDDMISRSERNPPPRPRPGPRSRRCRPGRPRRWTSGASTCNSSPPPSTPAATT